MKERALRPQIVDVSVPPVEQPASPMSKKGKGKSKLKQTRVGCSDDHGGAALEEAITEAEVVQGVQLARFDAA